MTAESSDNKLRESVDGAIAELVKQLPVPYLQAISLTSFGFVANYVNKNFTDCVHLGPVDPCMFITGLSNVAIVVGLFLAIFRVVFVKKSK